MYEELFEVVKARFAVGDRVWRFALLLRHRSQYPLVDIGTHTSWPQLAQLLRVDSHWLYQRCHLNLKKFISVGKLDLVNDMLPEFKNMKKNRKLNHEHLPVL